jgi:GH24 family phage-related lysozyme (muramidase)
MGLFDRKRSDLIRKYEGFEGDAYQLHGEDFHTIGYGSTSYEDGSPIGANDSISEERAQELLNHHIERTRGLVSEVPGYSQLSPNAQVAVDSFAYNTGPNFINDDDGFGTINRAIRAGDDQAVADALPLYDNGGLPGLVRRRQEEAELAVTPAMDPVDSTLARDRTRAFGTDAVLKGQPVKWGGVDYGWQSPESFAGITPPAPKPKPQPSAKPGFGNLFGLMK